MAARRGSSKRSATPRESVDEIAERRALLKRKLDEIDEILKELDSDEKETPSPEPDEAESAVAEVMEDAEPEAARPEVSVVVGNSAMAAEKPELVKQLAAMVNRAYGYQRVDRHDVRERLAMGDPGGGRANRVLHVALLAGEPVGCMSSTFRVPWAEDGCGHWGLLVVDVDHQGQGIASALVAAAEERLAGACVQIQIEYEYTHGEAYSDRLKAWYEGKCGFRCLSNGSRGCGTEFRKCRKRVPEEAQRRARRQRIASIYAELLAELAELESAPTEADS